MSRSQVLSGFRYRFFLSDALDHPLPPCGLAVQSVRELGRVRAAALMTNLTVGASHHLTTGRGGKLEMNFKMLGEARNLLQSDKSLLVSVSEELALIKYILECQNREHFVLDTIIDSKHVFNETILFLAFG